MIFAVMIGDTILALFNSLEAANIACRELFEETAYVEALWLPTGQV